MGVRAHVDKFNINKTQIVWILQQIKDSPYKTWAVNGEENDENA